MRKIYLIVVVALFIVIGINYYNFLKFQKDQVEFQKEVVLRQTRNIGGQLEKTISNYQNDLTKILFINTQYLPEIFSNEKVLNGVLTNLKSFYSKYRDLISNIAVYDNENKYLGLYIKENDDFVLDTFPRQNMNILQKRDIIIKRDGYYQSYFPFFKDNQLYGNIEVEINLERYLRNFLSLFVISSIEWQWLVDNNSQMIFSNRKDSIRINEINEISNAVLNGEEFTLEHSYSLKSGARKKIISAVYPLDMLNRDNGIVCTIETAHITDFFIKNNLRYLVISLLIIIALSSYLVYSVYAKRRKVLEKNAELLSFKLMFDQFPVGILIQDTLGKIKFINHSGQKMLFINKGEDIIGKPISSQFMISSKYLLNDSFSSSFDFSHFIHYEKDGNEIVIYRRDINANIAGEEIVISALIDVSALEKSRKQEAAANIAKSDFLAKMSHEIRTPMNGIISITENLLKGNLDKNQKEQIQIIRQSSDLLMNILNDFLDFSKIEAGKMMLEEIPFNLSYELNITCELFKSLADEKGLKLIIRIEPDVPGQLIGDPFRLRQVISNLVSNAVKFTHSGEIIIGVSLLERYNSALNLLFSVADTGIGIPKENLKKIFTSFEQGKESMARKYGGTGLGTAIAKQLVEMMNGDIWVESPSGTSSNPDFPGSKFSFSVELHSNEKLKKKYNFSSITQFQQVAVLILNRVKDEHDTVHHFLDQLGINFNYKMYNDTDIDSVIFHLEQKKELYQMLVIMDKSQNEGFTIARHLKDKRLSEYFLIVMVSSNNQQGNYQKCKALGIDYYLIQPYESIEFYNIIRNTFFNIKQSIDLTNLLNKIRTDLQILVAEDNLINQRITQNIFKHLGYEVDIAKNGIEVVEMVTNNSYDIIFMDLLMPEMNGIEATREIRKKWGDKIPIIAVTAVENEDRKQEALEAGMNGYVMKPVKVESIKQILLKWFSQVI
jgi:signal transduction histidine kinase/CheY-like chemotaxis protein